MQYSVRIEQDDYVNNPRNEFDNLSTFYAVRNSHYVTGGKDDIEFSYREDLEEELKSLRKDGAAIVEFFHYGDCYAVIERDKIKEEYIKHGCTMRKALYWARRCAQGEIDTFLAWCEGEVYGYIVEDEDGEDIDSCWGFYGEDGRKEAQSRAESFIEWKIKDDEKQERLINASCAI